MKLRQNINTVYHIAALVKFDKELKDELFEINYEGTKNTLEVSEMISAKKFFYVSTAYTLGKQEQGIEHLYDLSVEVNNPYEESKRLAEHLVFSYKDKMDVSIFRPAIIVGDSKTGKADSIFTLYGFIRGLEVFKKKVSRKKELSNKVFFILGDKNGTSNFVPVDYVSNILTIALQNAEKDKIYHITNPNAPTNKEILQAILDSIGFHNISIIKPEEKDFEFSKEEALLNELISAFNGYLTRTIQFSDRNTAELLNKVNQSTLTMDEGMLKTIINGYKS